MGGALLLHISSVLFCYLGKPNFKLDQFNTRAVRYLLYSYLLLVSHQLSAQQPNRSFELVTGLDYSYRTHLQDIGAGSIFDGVEKGIWTPRVGIGYQHRITERVWLYAGVRWRGSGTRTVWTDLTFPSDYDTLTQTFIPDPTRGAYRIRTADRYLEIPFTVRWQLGDAPRSLRPYITAGGAVLAYVNTKQRAGFEGDERVETFRIDSENFRRQQIAAVIGFGVDYTPSGKYHWFAQPTFRFHLTPEAKGVNEPAFRRHLWSLGLEVGARRVF